MDFFGIDYANYKNGKTINGIDTAVWVERYREPGEFTITGEPTEAFRKSMAVGKLISHTDTYDVMMVETHEIDETKEGPPVLVAKGRSVSAIAMEIRTVNPGLGPAEEAGWAQGFEIPPSGGTDDFLNQSTGLPLSATAVWEQISYLLNRFCVDNEADYTAENIPNLEIQVDISRDDPNPMDRLIKINTLSEEIKPLLESFDGGIRVERPSAALSHEDKMWFVVHEGKDLTSRIQFEYVRGDVENARYLWNGKNIRNKAYVRSQYYGAVVDPYFLFSGETLHLSGWRNRVKHVDFSEFSNYFTGDPVVDADIVAGMIAILYAKGWDELVKTTSDMLIMDATISGTSQFRYRRHYNIGDVVWVRGNYGMEAPMRVVEYAESMDKDGISGIPTLSYYRSPVDISNYAAQILFYMVNND